MAETELAASVEVPREELTEEAQLELIDLETGETPEPDTADSEPPETETAEPEAEEVQPETASVDYDQEVEVPMADGIEPMKLGELKDGYQTYWKRETELQRREAELSNEYSTLSRLQAEMQANGGRPLNEQQRNELGNAYRQRLARESHLMQESIPEWKDNAVFERDKRDIVEMMRPYGMNEKQIAGISDHRFALFLKHHLEMTRRIEKAEKVTKEPQKVTKRPKGKPPTRIGRQTRTDKLVQRAKTSRDPVLVDEAVAALLGER